MHRGLRPEILFVIQQRPDQPCRLKVMSLGKASKLDSPEGDFDDEQLHPAKKKKLTAFCAPESRFKDSLLADEWAIGVLLYYMFSGGSYPDFATSGKVKFTGKIWKKYDKKEEVKKLIKGLLTVDESKRMSA